MRTLEFDNDTRREYNGTVNLTVAGNLRTVTEGDIVVHLGVVGDVYALHEEVAVADAGLSVGECRTVHYHVLTEYVLIANHKAWHRLYS